MINFWASHKSRYFWLLYSGLDVGLEEVFVLGTVLIAGCFSHTQFQSMLGKQEMYFKTL